MEFNLRAPSTPVDKTDRAYAEKKLTTALRKVLGSTAARIDVEVSSPSHSSSKPLTEVDVHVFIPRTKTQVVKVQAEELRECIDLATDKIMRAVKRHRNRRRDKMRHSGEFPAATAPDHDDADEIDTLPLS